MHVQRVFSKGKNGQIYESILLRTSKRIGKKVASVTLAVLTHLPGWLIEVVERAVKLGGNADSLDQLAVASGSLEVRSAESFGAIHAVMEVAKATGIPQALGGGDTAKLVLWQTLARVLHPSVSLLGMVRMLAATAASRLLGIVQSFTEDDMYRSGEWIVTNQPRIEKELFDNMPRPSQGLYFYDVTSSYFEGVENELAEFGYNRDKIKGKKQVVMGLLTDAEGEPLSVQLFPGNTSDLATFKEQIHKVKEHFGEQNVTLVGDRGMIRQPQQQQANAAGLHYISALHKAEIETLLKSGTLQMSLFDTDVQEIVLEDGRRLITRLNPIRRDELKAMHDGFKQRMEAWLAKSNAYLKEHPKARVATQIKEGTRRLAKGGLKAWMTLTATGRELVLTGDAEARKAHTKLDGCYAIVSDLPKIAATSQQLHDNYKRLNQVEQDFRTLKHGHLEMRPWYVRSEENTRAHGFTAMLALKVRRRLEQAWRELNITVEEGLAELGKLCVMELAEKKTGTVVSRLLPKPNKLQAALLERAGVALPKEAPKPGVAVATRVRLEDRRKSKVIN